MNILLKSSRKKLPSPALILLAVLFITVLSPLVMGDRGGFSPSRMQVTETTQKAIIAWNGTREALILSTNVFSGNETEVLEIMPLPSNPSISKTETESFTRITNVVNHYYDLKADRRFNRYPLYVFSQGRSLGPDAAPKVSITFQEAIGFHFLTVLKAEDSMELAAWLNDFLQNRNSAFELPANVTRLIDRYIEDNIKFFAVDLIKADSTEKTVDTLIYEFETPKLYYPLRISSLFSGDTSISLFTITTNELKQDSILGGQFRIGAQFYVEKGAPERICTNLTDLFSADPCLSYFTYSGPQQRFYDDIKAEAKPSSNTPALVAATLNVGFGLTLLLLFLASKMGGLLNLRITKHELMQRAFLLTGLLGVCLVWAGFAVPWGFTQFGDVLLPVDGTNTTTLFSTFTGLLYMLLLIGAIPCYIYLLILGGTSKKAATHFTATGVCTIIVALLTGASVLHSVSIGMHITITGCAFLILAGALCLNRLQSETISEHTISNFRTYVARKFLLSVLTLAGVLIVVFWLITLLHPVWRIGLY